MSSHAEEHNRIKAYLKTILIVYSLVYIFIVSKTIVTVIRAFHCNYPVYGPICYISNSCFVVILVIVIKHSIRPYPSVLHININISYFPLIRLPVMSLDCERKLLVYVPYSIISRVLNFFLILFCQSKFSLCSLSR